jgi:hypothetical protein
MPLGSYHIHFTLFIPPLGHNIDNVDCSRDYLEKKGMFEPVWVSGTRKRKHE